MRALGRFLTAGPVRALYLIRDDRRARRASDRKTLPASSPKAPGTANATLNIAPIEASIARRTPSRSTSIVLVNHTYTLHAHQSAASTSIPRKTPPPVGVVREQDRDLGDGEHEGQTIYVTEGIALAQCRGGPIKVIRPGDRVFFEPAKTTGMASPPTAS